MMGTSVEEGETVYPHPEGSVRMLTAVVCDTSHRVKEIRGSARAVVRARPKECFALLAAVDRYSGWNGELVRELEVLERGSDDRPARLRAVIDLKRSPFVGSLDVTVAVRTEPPRAVYITRIPNEPSDPERLELVWRIDRDRSRCGTRIDRDDSRSGTRIDLDLLAVAAFVPGFIPLGGIGDLVAEKLLGSAADTLGRFSQRL
jgi:hypothetical protein